MNKIWKLNDCNIHIFDKIKLCYFLITDSYWTRGKYCKYFEQRMSDYVNVKHSIFLSNGSTANTVLSYYLKDYFYTEEKNIVIFPSVTWSTSIVPFLREGFVPKFIDINLQDLSIDLNKLEDFLKDNSEKISCVFITSLLGISPDINRILKLKDKYNVKIMMDNCENTFGSYNNKNISSYFTSTTSTYFGHQLQSVEGGFIFTNDDEEHDLFRMYMNHGMTRVINNTKYKNEDVHESFDFYNKGNNFRNSDINAFIGLLDFKNIKKHIHNRKEMYEYFKSNIKNKNSLLLFNDSCFKENVLFSIPLIFNDISLKEKVLSFCEKNSIETRPIISGNLLRQTCFKNIDDFKKFENAEFVHKNGFYIGLHSKVTKKQILNLVNFINKNG